MEPGHTPLCRQVIPYHWARTYPTIYLGYTPLQSQYPSYHNVSTYPCVVAVAIPPTSQQTPQYGANTHTMSPVQSFQGVSTHKLSWSQSHLIKDQAYINTGPSQHGTFPTGLKLLLHCPSPCRAPPYPALPILHTLALYCHPWWPTLSSVCFLVPLLPCLCLSPVLSYAPAKSGHQRPIVLWSLWSQLHM